MPGEYYTGEDETPAGGPSGMEGEGTETDKPEDQGEETALLPKSILAGKEFKVGDEVVLKITAMHEDQIEVAYATEKSDSEETPEPRSTGNSMDRMQKYAMS